MADSSNRSPSPKPPTVNPDGITSHRFAALHKVYTSALRATLTTNSYPNFASCFPTPATYCPRALEGVWKQLNTRLEEECLKDFEKICHERDVERGLGAWEQLVEEAKARKMQEDEARSDSSDPSAVHPQDTRPMHLLSAQEMHTAYLAPTLLKAQHELQSKLDHVQSNNQDTISKIEQQKIDMETLVLQLETMIEDVENAARVLESDPMKDVLRRGVDATPIDTEIQDV